jgi:hypothetical protein
LLTITVTPHAEPGHDPDVQFTALVDVSGPEPLLREVTTTALNGSGLHSDSLPPVDWTLLTQACAGGSAPVTATPVITPAPAKAKVNKTPAKATAKAAPAKSTPAPTKVTKPKETAGDAAEGGRRPYRKYPGDEAVRRAIEKVGDSPVALMAELEVPRHTVIGWRKQYWGNTGTGPADNSSGEGSEG